MPKRRVVKEMRRLNWLVVLFLLLVGCASVLKVQDVPEVRLDQATFFPTIKAHTDAPILGGNRIDILRNGDETFPVMLHEIRRAKSSITMAQYLYEDGSIAREFAQAFAERCKAGVGAHILLDHYGSAKAPSDVIKTMRDAGCQVEYFRRVKADGIVFPWRLLRYNYRSHRRILVIDGRIGFTGGYGIGDAWKGNGRTPDHWRDTNARIEGPAVKFLQSGFAESWLEATGVVIGGELFSAPRTGGQGAGAIRQEFPNRRQFSKLHAVLTFDQLGQRINSHYEPVLHPRQCDDRGFSEGGRARRSGNGARARENR
jgi:phosphatidylserine/phosphatidylglycerophosphate/cardiolipin synthase-like enzyme